MSHTVKLFERIINHMLRTIVELGNINFVFRRGRSTMDPAFVAYAFVLQFMQETYKEKPHDLHMTSADILCLQRVDMEHHANDRNCRGVRQCALCRIHNRSSSPKHEMDVTQLYNRS